MLLCYSVTLLLNSASYPYIWEFAFLFVPLPIEVYTILDKW